MSSNHNYIISSNHNKTSEEKVREKGYILILVFLLLLIYNYWFETENTVLYLKKSYFTSLQQDISGTTRRLGM